MTGIQSAPSRLQAYDPYANPVQGIPLYRHQGPETLAPMTFIKAVNQLKEKMITIANSVLPKDQQTPLLQHSQGPSSTNPHFTYNDNSWRILNSETRHNTHTERQTERNNTVMRILVGAVATIALGLLGYIGGTVFAIYRMEKNEKSEFDDCVKTYNDRLVAESYINNEIIDNCIARTFTILENKESSRRHKLILFAAGASSAIAALAGALLNSRSLMLASIGAGVVTGASALFKWSYESTLTFNQNEAKEIINALVPRRPPALYTSGRAF